MRRALLLCSLACAAVTAARAAPLVLADQWTAGGQPVYGQTRAALSAARPAALKTQPKYPAGAVRYALFGFLDGAGKTVNLAAVLVGDLARPVALFVDSDQDGVLTAREQARPLPKAQRPPDFGKPTEAVWTAPLRRPYPRTLALRVSPIGAMLTAAVRGAYRAEVPVAGKRHALVVVDADADLWLKPGRDYAYLDLNGDGKFDPAAEKFLDLAALEVSGQALRVAPEMSVAAAQWSAAPSGGTNVTFSLGSLTRTPAKLLVSLTRDERESLMVKVLGEPVALRAGSYTIGSILAQAQTPEGSARTYTFEYNSAGGFDVAPDKPAAVDLLGKVSVNVGVTGEPQAGGTLDLEVTATTSTGLRMTACTAGEADTRQQGLVPPEIEFRAPDGTVLESGPMEFG